ncbi:MAG: coiled-coil domain-containing protein [Planctomycetota bacterium]
MLLLIVFTSAPASAVDKLDLRRKQVDQQRARAMAQKLVATAIDQQLHQLEDNGLTDLPVYGEIKSMQQNIGSLVEQEMAKVVDILLDAQQLKTTDEREAKFIEARSTIRNIVLQLAVERQKLLKRLKTEEIALQAKRLIRLEGEALTTTKGLPEESQTRREQLTVQTIEDQRDIRELFLHLVETLVDVSEWGGPLGDGAVRGLRILKAAEVGQHLDKAGRELESTRYAAAAVEQATVISGLKKLLDEIQRTQGVLSSDNESLLDTVKELAEQQQELREKVDEADLSDLSETNELINEQKAIQEALQELATQLPEDARAEAHLESAIESAEEAGEEIFSNEKDDALDSQREVEGQLAALEEQLLNGAEQDLQNRTAEELAEVVRGLEEQKSELQQAQAQQEAAKEALESSPVEAARLVDDVSKQLAEIDKAAEERDLTDTVEAQIEDATEAAQAAADLPLESTKPTDAESLKEARDALDNAADALDRALASTEESLAEAKRIEAAVKIGELARAAEALERASAAERQIAEAAKQAQKSEEPLAPEKPARIKQQQEDIDDVVKSLAEGVAATAPETAKKLQETLAKNEQLKPAVEDFTKAAAMEAVANAGRKGAEDAGDEKLAAETAKVEQQAREQRKEAAGDVAPRAEAAANELADAAKTLRNEIAEAAEKLSELTSEQLAKVDAAQESVDAAITAAEQTVAERLEQLNEAREKVADAAAQQQKAAGRPEAAASMELARAINKAAQQQAMAEQAAEDLASGEAATPLEAATAQQGVADAAEQLSEQANARAQAEQAKQDGKSDELAAALQQAQQAASEAARQTLDGNSAQADAAREQAKAALQKAAELAKAETAAAQEAEPTGKPDATAQAEVAKSADVAKQLAGEDSASANESLQAASEAATEAAGKLGENLPELAREPQKKAGESLAEADAQLAAEMQQLAGQEAEQLAAVQDKTNQAARKAAEVDASAAAALRDAQKNAEETQQAAMAAAEQDAQEAEMAAALRPQGSELQPNLDRAAADLAAKEQQLEREQALAQALAELAKSQQESVDALADARDEVEEAVEGMTPEEQAEAGMSKSHQQAAQKLGQAMQRFAESQRLTGEGAVELSGQEEVANEPIREALELASDLLQDLQPADPNAQPDAVAAADPQQLPEGAQPSAETAQPADTAAGEQPADSPLGDLAQGEQPGENGAQQPGQPGQQPGTGQSPDLGTGFVPNSPETTARMMAGPELLSELSELMQAQLEEAMENAREAGQGDQLAANDAQQPGNQPPQNKAPNQPSQSQQSQSAPAVANGAAQASEFTENDPTKDESLNVVDTSNSTGDSQTPDSKNTRRDIDDRRFDQAAWFAKLPPELRNAIQASSRRRAPRAYEERLRRYFESLE